MSLVLLAVAALAAINAPRVRSALPAREARLVGALAAVGVWGALVPVAAFATPALDAMGVAAPTLRMAVGVVLVLQGAAVLVTRLPGPEPSLEGRWAAVVPVAFPVTLTPGLALLALSAAVDRSAPLALAILAAALATIPALTMAAPAPGTPVRERALTGLAKLTAGALVAAGIALLMHGLFDV